MALTREQMDQKLHEHFDFEARDDIEGVLATLAEDVTHDVVGWPTGPTQGRESVRPVYETLFADLADSTVKSVRRLYGENFLVDESVWEGRAVGRPYGFEGRGRPLRFRLLHVLEFTETGQIQREQVWADLTAMIHQLPKD